MGMSFPGGAPPALHFLNHVAETWLPFLVAFFVARCLAGRRIRAAGRVTLYGASLLWSVAMVWLDRQGVAVGTIFNVGLAGTFVGGAVLYLRLVDPGR